MAEFPRQYVFPDPLVHISSTSINSVMCYVNSSPGSAVFPTANLAIFVPFRIGRPMTISSLFALNGAAVSGNIDLGIYSADGTKIISTGSTAQAGTSVMQAISVTSTQIGAGLFYLAVAMDNTTGTLIRWAPGAAPISKMIGLAQMATAFPLPATATLATVANAYVPDIGCTGRSVV